MKKLIVLCLLLSCSYTILQAQDSATIEKYIEKDLPSRQTNLANRPKDHFLILVGNNIWTKAPDSIETKGLQRSASVYFMFDFPFKTDPRFSVGIGAGIGSDNQYFNNTYIDIAGRSNNQLRFQDVADTNHFKKYKLNVTYLEAPVELRYTAKPENPNKSFKAAIGMKIGTMLSAHTKGKNLLNSSDAVINAYTAKEKSKTFFNTTRLSVMGRFGYGIINLYASYQINAFVKEGFGPDVRPLQIGIAITGL